MKAAQHFMQQRHGADAVAGVLQGAEGRLAFRAHGLKLKQAFHNLQVILDAVMDREQRFFFTEREAQGLLGKLPLAYLFPQQPYCFFKPLRPLRNPGLKLYFLSAPAAPAYPAARYASAPAPAPLRPAAAWLCNLRLRP